jgi:hypothetical protein
MYEVAFGFYHVALEQPEQTPEWLSGEVSPNTRSSFLEDYANRVKAQYHYQTRQYGALLAYIENMMGQQTVLFGEIELKVLQALSLYQIKRFGEAIAALTEAYDLAESNKLVVPFTQYAKGMRTLTAAALKDDTCPIPREWLEAINRESSACAKRRAKMVTDYRAANHSDKEVSLSSRKKKP